MNSATGVAIQTPCTPKNRGRMPIVMSMNTKERENASTAETLPLDKAVNMPLMKMLKPMKNRAIVHTRFPVTAS